jgi:hypothetical protein
MESRDFQSRLLGARSTGNSQARPVRAGSTIRRGCCLTPDSPASWELDFIYTPSLDVERDAWYFIGGLGGRLVYRVADLKTQLTRPGASASFEGRRDF